MFALSPFKKSSSGVEADDPGRRSVYRQPSVAGEEFGRLYQDRTAHIEETALISAAAIRL
jgi:hypothetical protein